MMDLRRVTRVGAAVIAVSIGAARGQWDPASGAWLKSHAADLRVMTFNVRDTIRSTNVKTEGFNDWTAVARIVAALRPDVLLLQETGDNNAFGQVDSEIVLAVTIGLFFHGGTDPFTPGDPPVTAYVQKYAPGYDLPNVFVSAETDAFNRNVILCRHPFTDLNGDTRSMISDLPTVSPDAYAPGGDGGIRGFAFAEVSLPDTIYRGDLVVGNAHLKAGGGASNAAQRLLAAQNTAYVIDYWFNGAGFGVPDPHGAIADQPPATVVLDALTPVVIGGDWNQDELTDGVRGPADWLTQAQLVGGTDGVDRDRSDATFDSATQVFTGSRATHGSSKLDYVAWQDSLATVRRAFVFDSAGTPPFAWPPEFNGFADPAAISGVASDHRPVVADLIMPIRHDGDGDGDVDLTDFAGFAACEGGPGGDAGDGCAVHDADGDGDVDMIDFASLTLVFTGEQ